MCFCPSFCLSHHSTAGWSGFAAECRAYRRYWLTAAGTMCPASTALQHSAQESVCPIIQQQCAVGLLLSAMHTGDIDWQQRAGRWNGTAARCTAANGWAVSYWQSSAWGWTQIGWFFSSLLESHWAIVYTMRYCGCCVRLLGFVKRNWKLLSTGMVQASWTWSRPYHCMICYTCTYGVINACFCIAQAFVTTWKAIILCALQRLTLTHHMDYYGTG